MSYYNPLPLDTVVTDPGLIALGITPRTLAQSFAANHKKVGTLGAGHYDTGRINGHRSLEQGAGLNLGELYALWVEASLEVVENDHSAETDALLAEVRELPDGQAVSADWIARSHASDRRAVRRRTAITKRAYGIPYTTFTADPQER